MRRDLRENTAFGRLSPCGTGGRETAHIHFAINKNGHRLLTSQMYVKDNPDNEWDSIFRNTGRASHDLLSVPFKPLPGSEIGELTANFDIVIGEAARRTGKMTAGDEVGDAGGGKKCVS